MKRLSREQMKMVKGGSPVLTCSANCAPGTSGGTCSGYDSCTVNPGTNGYDESVTCTLGGITKKAYCVAYAPQ